MSIKQLPAALKAKAKEELNEVEERIPQDLQQIKDWIQKQPHLKTWDGKKFEFSRQKLILNPYLFISR